MNVVSISGSPSARSRSAWLLRLAASRLAQPEHRVHEIAVRDLPADALLAARTDDAALRDAIDAVARARLVIVSTPIYKAAYSGLLKTFLDLLPQDALRDKAVLPLATGGSPAHLLALEYALKPVLAAMGARHIVDAIYVCDTQLTVHETLGFVAEDPIVARIDRALQDALDSPVLRRAAVRDAMLAPWPVLPAPAAQPAPPAHTAPAGA